MREKERKRERDKETKRERKKKKKKKKKKEIGEPLLLSGLGLLHFVIMFELVKNPHVDKNGTVFHSFWLCQ